MNEVCTNLGEQSDINAVSKVVSVKGLSIVDVGCGPGALARDLCALGATVLGVEPDPIQAEKNRNAAQTTGLQFAEAGAESLPVLDASADGVFFCRSLHHVPTEHMDGALKEARRVLKRQSAPFHDGRRGDPVVRADGNERRRLGCTEIRMARVQQHDGCGRRQRLSAEMCGAV